jgi:hypothetical protein
LTLFETSIFHIGIYIDTIFRSLSAHSYLQHILLHIYISCLRLFCFMYIMCLYVLPKGFRFCAYRIRLMYLFILVTMWVWKQNLSSS